MDPSCGAQMMMKAMVVHLNLDLTPMQTELGFATLD